MRLFFFFKKCYTKLILKWWGIDDEIGFCYNIDRKGHVSF